MTYKLEFVRSALKEWQKLDTGIRELFKKQLIKRLKNPKVASARLHGLENCYKIKLCQTGYRLVNQIIDKEVVVLVVAVGKRERNAVYKAAIRRL